MRGSGDYSVEQSESDSQRWTLDFLPNVWNLKRCQENKEEQKEWKEEEAGC